LASQSYKERVRAARAEARAKREAEKTEWHRRIELSVEVRRVALAATKAAIRARGDTLGRPSGPEEARRLGKRDGAATFSIHFLRDHEALALGRNQC
jgi:hypothetical protein